MCRFVCLYASLLVLASLMPLSNETTPTLSLGSYSDVFSLNATQEIAEYSFSAMVNTTRTLSNGTNVTEMQNQTFSFNYTKMVCVGVGVDGVGREAKGERDGILCVLSFKWQIHLILHVFQIL